MHDDSNETTIVVMTQRFSIVFADETRKHLESIERKYHGVIREAIEEQLRYEPFVEHKNRKRLRTTDEIWEIRCGPQNRLRIFYMPEGETQLRILAIGVKTRNVLRIGREVVEL